MPDFFYRHFKFAIKKGKYIVCSFLIPNKKTVRTMIVKDSTFQCVSYLIRVSQLDPFNIICSCSIQAKLAFTTFEGKTYFNLYFKENHEISKDNAKNDGKALVLE